MNNKKHIVILTRTALFLALAFIVTFFIMVPVGNGNFNLGDSVILISSLFLPISAVAFVGGVGPALADLASGFATFAPFTLIIKGIEGLIIALVYKKMKVIKNDYLRFFVGTLLAVIIIPVGYFFANWILFGLGGTVQALINDIVQAVSSVAVANVLFFALKKANLYVED